MAAALLPVATTPTTSLPRRRHGASLRLHRDGTSLRLYRHSLGQLRLHSPLRLSATPDDDASTGEPPSEKGEDESKPSSSSSSVISAEEVEEIKRRLAEARGAGGGGGFFGGVAEEVGAIEWPAFGKVVGTTGVVLSVIFGSSVALLTVNAILSELSDRLFTGRGVQDFFS